MKFLNKKEEVIDLQLTQHGKRLLSNGEFNPVFYSFLDDDVLYDSRYTGILNEVQNNIHDRIKDVPKSETQYVFDGIETNIKNNSFVDKKLYNLVPMGTISLESPSAPAWSINTLKGSISSSNYYQFGDEPNVKIPILNLNSILYKTIAEKDTDILPENISDLSFITPKFEDGSFINIIEDSIVLEIDELNSIFGNENFDVEVFLVENEIIGGNVKEILKPLSFATKNKSLIKNNILLDSEEIKDLNIQAEINPNCVEYYFDVFTDKEVDKDIICKYANNKHENTLIDKITDCEEQVINVSKNIYSPNTTEESIKDC